MKNEQKQKNITNLNNRKAGYEYDLKGGDTYEAGIVLEGCEIKSLCKNQASVSEAYCKVSKNSREIYIVNMYIKRYEQAFYDNNIDEYRDRKLLLHKNEIKKIANKVNEKGWTIVPVHVYNSFGGTETVNGEIVRKKKNIVKVKICVCQGKKAYNKREAIKEKDLKRAMQRDMK